MTNLLAPTTADGWLEQALLERLRGNDEAAARSEQRAHDCDGYTPDMCVRSYLLHAAKRHAQFKDDERWAEVLTSAQEHARGDLYAQLMILAGTGSSLIWRGRVAEAFFMLVAADTILAPLARIHPRFFGLWMYALKEVVFALRCLAEQPDEAAKVIAQLG